MAGNQEEIARESLLCESLVTVIFYWISGGWNHRSSGAFVKFLTLNRPIFTSALEKFQSAVSCTSLVCQPHLSWNVFTKLTRRGHTGTQHQPGSGNTNLYCFKADKIQYQWRRLDSKAHLVLNYHAISAKAKQEWGSDFRCHLRSTSPLEFDRMMQIWTSVVPWSEWGSLSPGSHGHPRWTSAWPLAVRHVTYLQR